MGNTPTLEGIFRKYGETAEAAQLLQTELGTLLLSEQCVTEGLFGADGIRAAAIMRSINRDTFGELIRKARSGQSIEEVVALLEAALRDRNRLIHSFYREHNMRKFSDYGRMSMMQDLDDIHATILGAYNALILLGGTDLDELAKQEFTPSKGYLPI